MENEIANKTNRRKKGICILIGICIGALAAGYVGNKRIIAVNARIAQTQEDLSKEVFRFHVLADSDSEEAQNVKLKVRDRILKYMQENMPGNQELFSAQQTKEWAASHLFEISGIAREVIREEGYSYGAEAQVVYCYFPEKRYGDITFPQGYYQALRVKLGAAKGHNWWCVLYPNLCFNSSVCAVTEEAGKEELKEALAEEEYEMVTAVTDYKIKSFFFDFDKK